MQKSRARASEHISHHATAALLLPQEQARTGAVVVMALAAGAGGASATHEGHCRVRCERVKGGGGIGGAGGGYGA